MSYNFVRVHKKNSKDYGNWFMKPESLEQINEHWKTICSSEIKKTIKDRINGVLKYGRAGHPTTSFGTTVDCLCDVYNLSYIEGCINIEQQAYKQRHDSFLKGEEIYLADSMTVFMIDDRFFEIAETRTCENLVYPTQHEFSMDDVRYMQWNMLGNTGEHYYCKIGKYDVFDSHGNMKWNTKKEAEQAAKWFLENKMKN